MEDSGKHDIHGLCGSVDHAREKDKLSTEQACNRQAFNRKSLQWCMILSHKLEIATNMFMFLFEDWLISRVMLWSY